MRPLPSPPVQLITGAWRDVADLRSHIEAALRGGIRWVQLRAKDRSTHDLYDAAVAIAPLLQEASALFVVNDRVDVALAAGADGVHLPEDGMSPADARTLLGPSAWIGLSVHSVDAIRVLGAGQVDAVQFGPVFDTASKRAFGAPHGLVTLAEASRAAHAGTAMMLIAVGGISASCILDCHAAGADAVAVIGAVWDATDIETTAGSLIRRGIIPAAEE